MKHCGKKGYYIGLVMMLVSVVLVCFYYLPGGISSAQNVAIFLEHESNTETSTETTSETTSETTEGLTETTSKTTEGLTETRTETTSETTEGLTVAELPQEKDDGVRKRMEEEENKLPQSVIDRVKTFVFFVGHARSGHSIVGSLMDGHPHMVISHEFDLFTKLSDGSLVPNKSAIFNGLWRNTRRALSGFRAKSTDGKGYTLFVDGLYQGRYIDHIDVIGDKKGDVTTYLLLTKPNKWSNALNVLRSLNVTLKVIHVIRNPYDNIATALMYLKYKDTNFGDIKKKKLIYEFDSGTIKSRINGHFSYHRAIERATKTYNLDLIQIHGKELILDPTGTLLKLCNYLGITCSNNYLEICSNKLYKNESRTRHMIKWTDEYLSMIQQNIEKHSSLKGYSFDSM